MTQENLDKFTIDQELVLKIKEKRHSNRFKNIYSDESLIIMWKLRETHEMTPPEIARYMKKKYGFTPSVSYIRKLSDTLKKRFTEEELIEIISFKDGYYPIYIKRPTKTPKKGQNQEENPSTENDLKRVVEDVENNEQKRVVDSCQKSNELKNSGEKKKVETPASDKAETVSKNDKKRTKTEDNKKVKSGTNETGEKPEQNSVPKDKETKSKDKGVNQKLLRKNELLDKKERGEKLTLAEESELWNLMELRFDHLLPQ